MEIVQFWSYSVSQVDTNALKDYCFGMSELIDPKRNTFFETDAEGRIQEVDMLTGNIIRRAQSVEDLLEGKQLEPTAGNKRIWKYSRAFGDIICQKIAEGNTLSEICNMQGFPALSTLARWRAENDDFEEALKVARRMRAEKYHDEIANDVVDDNGAEKDEIPARKLKMDRLKWLASVNDPETYGNKTKISGDSSAPLQIVVSTGIDRGNNENGESS